jgi:hypothetical protein
MSWYCFSQNNSGGQFHIDSVSGIAGHVIIEADSAEEANEKALDIGLYWDGCAKEIDCECCGDRWYPVDEFEKSDNGAPMVYHKTPYEYALADMFNSGVAVHFKDGQIRFFDNCSGKLSFVGNCARLDKEGLKW